MAEYISREAALSALYYARGRSPEEDIKSIPAADVVEVRHGRWERSEGSPYPYCSYCGCESLSRADRPYCQFCGAKMDGGQDDV
jgi:hypothetical protein